MPFRPDLVDCWIVRPTLEVHPREPLDLEVLLLRRAPGRILPGLWQCVSGSVEADERIALAALRELREETGLDAPEIEAFYDLDLVNQFHEPSYDAIVSSAVFAVRVHPGSRAVLSHEHDALRWVDLHSARREVVWPGYREALQRIADNLADAERARWFELTLAGDRVPR